MRIVLYGGFGEKGRTCVGVESNGYRLLLDAGVKTSVKGREYYPAISAAMLSAQDAIVITHAHEDHAAALGWCIAGGFGGRVFMTPQTLSEARLCWEGYAEPAHRSLALCADVEVLPARGKLTLGPLRVSTGRSGHIAGGVWCAIDDGKVTLCYCGDVVPASPIFAMDPLPHSDAIALDASYGDDTLAPREHVARIVEWIAARPEGCVLPTPLSGRSAELLAIIPGPIALCAGMRDALAAQVADSEWLVEGASSQLAARLDVALDWHGETALPRAALLCHDGMGIAGPSRDILAKARMDNHATLFTGHVPQNSPGERMLAEGRASWLRLPTHPTLAENLAIVASTGPSTVLGHSCDSALLTRLKIHFPSLRTDLATGDMIDL